MTGFLVLTCLMVAAVLWLLLRTAMGGKAPPHASHRQLNAEIYRDQFAQLERDRADHLLADQDYVQARAELQRRILDEASDEKVATTVHAPNKTLLGLGVLVPMAAIGLYLMVGNPGALNPEGPQQPSAQQDLNRMVEGLAQKLEKEPDNLQGWAMLARSYKVLGRTVEAEQAFDRAGSFMDGDAQLLAMYADIAATNAGGNFTGKPLALIHKALQVDPANGMALWLAGSAAFQNNEFNTAIQDWERLAKQLPADSDDARALQESIGAAYAKLGRSAPQPAATPSGTTGTDKGTEPAATAASVRGEVDLDPALKSKMSPDDTVMVIARVPGTRMPVAVLRLRAATLPLQFILDDSLSMSPQARISAAAQVEVEARISKSGMALPQAGDLVSDTQTVNVGASGLTLHVTRVRP